MAENKKSFILYADLLLVVDQLPDEIAGKLFKTILLYVNDKEICIEDLLLKIAFEPIKNQLKRDLKNWEKFKLKQSENGKLGGRPVKTEKPNNPSLISESQKSLNVTVNDTVNVNANVTEESNTHPLKNSNLFRQPKIPELEQVRHAFFSAGGSEDMAQSFFDKNQATGWFLKGSPITNFINLIPSYISNWTKNESKSTTRKTTSADRTAARSQQADRYSEGSSGG